MQETTKKNLGSIATHPSCLVPQFIRRLKVLLAGSAVVATAMLPAGEAARAQNAPAPAVAQAPTEQGPQPRQEPDNRTPAQRAAENYDAPGVRVGSFLLFPELEADETFNDNIYASSNATGKMASFIQGIKPSLKLNSDWSNHMLNFFATGAFAFYSADSSQNYQDFSVGADGRFDIEHEWNTYGGVSYSRKNEALGTPNSATGTVQPTQYYQLAGNVGYYQRFGLIKTRLDGRIDNYNYLNNGNGPAQGVIVNTDRNRTEFHEALRVGYEFIPGYEIWTRGTLNQRQYTNV